VDPYGKREILDCFGRHLRHHGDTPQAVRWTVKGQQLRYQAFLGLCGDLAGKSVLDFGCGKGDLYGFSRAHGDSVEAILPLLFGCAREALHANFLTARERLSPHAVVREDLVPEDFYLSVCR